MILRAFGRAWSAVAQPLAAPVLIVGGARVPAIAVSAGMSADGSGPRWNADFRVPAAFATAATRLGGRDRARAAPRPSRRSAARTRPTTRPPACVASPACSAPSATSSGGSSPFGRARGTRDGVAAASERGRTRPGDRTCGTFRQPRGGRAGARRRPTRPARKRSATPMRSGDSSPPPARPAPGAADAPPRFPHVGPVAAAVRRRTGPAPQRRRSCGPSPPEPGRRPRRGGRSPTEAARPPLPAAPRAGLDRGHGARARAGPAAAPAADGAAASGSARAPWPPGDALVADAATTSPGRSPSRPRLPLVPRRGSGGAAGRHRPDAPGEPPPRARTALDAWMAQMAVSLGRASSPATPSAGCPSRGSTGSWIVVTGAEPHQLRAGPGLVAGARSRPRRDHDHLRPHHDLRGPFRRLGALRPGDRLELALPYGDFAYEVERSESTTDARPATAPGSPRLVLTAPASRLGGAQWRMVTARQVGVARPADLPAEGGARRPQPCARARDREGEPAFGVLERRGAEQLAQARRAGSGRSADGSRGPRRCAGSAPAGRARRAGWRGCGPGRRRPAPSNGASSASASAAASGAAAPWRTSPSRCSSATSRPSEGRWPRRDRDVREAGPPQALRAPAWTAAVGPSTARSPAERGGELRAAPGRLRVGDPGDRPPPPPGGRDDLHAEPGGEPARILLRRRRPARPAAREASMPRRGRAPRAPRAWPPRRRGPGSGHGVGVPARPARSDCASA